MSDDDRPCTEAAPCFACLRCFVALTNILATDPNVRVHMAGVETRPTWKPAWKHAAEAGGTLPSADAAYPAWIEPGRAASLRGAHVATLPDGSRVEFPAGTVLREGTLPPEIEPDEPKTLGEQLHDEHDHTTHADGSCCLCDPATVNRNKPGCSRAKLVNCGDFGVECHDPTCPIAVNGWHGTSFRLAYLTERMGLPREMAPSVLRVNGVPVAEVTSARIERTVNHWTSDPSPTPGTYIGEPVVCTGTTVSAERVFEELPSEEVDPWLARSHPRRL